jgi:hypothetical protein
MMTVRLGALREQRLGRFWIEQGVSGFGARLVVVEPGAYDLALEGASSGWPGHAARSVLAEPCGTKLHVAAG